MMGNEQQFLAISNGRHLTVCAGCTVHLIQRTACTAKFNILGHRSCCGSLSADNQQNGARSMHYFAQALVSPPAAVQCRGESCGHYTHLVSCIIAQNQAG